MSSKRIFFLALSAIFLSAVLVHQAEGGKMKKIIAATILAQTLKPRFIPLPIPIPFKLKINKGDKVVPYPVHSHDMYGMGGGGYGMGGGGGGYGMMGGGGNDWY